MSLFELQVAALTIKSPGTRDYSRGWSCIYEMLNRFRGIFHPLGSHFFHFFYYANKITEQGSVSLTYAHRHIPLFHPRWWCGSCYVSCRRNKKQWQTACWQEPSSSWCLGQFGRHGLWWCRSAAPWRGEDEAERQDLRRNSDKTVSSE